MSSSGLSASFPLLRTLLVSYSLIQKEQKHRDNMG